MSDSLSSELRFEQGFVWGTATAAYQVEGAVHADGRGMSIWDTFARQAGNVRNGENGDIACDHYNRYPEDIELIRQLGVGAYRFSVAWPRIQPEGKGASNSKGLDFYERLVDELLAASIVPCLTLYHWDLPQPLEDEGGWRNRDTAARFAEYAAIVHGRLGARVPLWITLNEPYCAAFLGYAEGRHAPGAREGHGALAAAHHLMVGHGMAVNAMRAQLRGSEQFGITLNMNPVTAVTESEDDAAAAERVECAQNRVFTDPILAGQYPAVENRLWGDLTDFSFRMEGDLELASTDVDFLGVNNYFPAYVRSAPYAEPDPGLRTAVDIGAKMAPPDQLPRTTMDWPVEAEGLSRLLLWLKETYPGLPPVYITENGTSGFDEPDEDGRVRDLHRTRYLDGHLRAVRSAMNQGVDVRGYFCWSLLDNFEWGEGYRQRFGLVYVDFDTQQRIPKDSFHWYRRVVLGLD